MLFRRGESENLSYLVPRDPSIKCWNDRVKLPAPLTQNLVRLGMDESDELEHEKLKVFLRIKPCQVECNPYSIVNNTLEAEAPKDSIPFKKLSKNVGKLIHKFHFTSIFNQHATQENVFKKCALGNLKQFIHGENEALFAYGTTNAGKTFTMQGTVESPGVIPQAMQFVFNSLKNKMESFCQYQPHHYNELYHLNDDELWKEMLHKNFILNLDITKYQRHPEMSYRSYRTETTASLSGFSDVYENVTFRDMESKLMDLKYEVEDSRYSLWISMIEIYNEQVYDLLEVPDEKEGRIKRGFAEDENGKVYIKNLRYVNVTSGHEAFQMFEFGKANLRFGATALNNQSSRSHCIFTLTLARFLDDKDTVRAVLSRFSFCDLAGIERVKKALIEGQRLVESKSINTSLSIFVKCLTIVRENQTTRGKKVVPYRESKLTRLFRDAMMGKEKFSIIVNVTPEPHLFSETVNVLKFSALAQQIVPVNIFPKSKTVRGGRKSKFASVVANTNDNSEINWESTNITDVNKSKSDANVFQELMNLVDKLRTELEEERNRADNIEKQVREELATKFSEMVNAQNETNRNRLESEAQRMQEMFDRKQKRLIEYYEKQREKSKRKRMEEDYSEYVEMESQMETMKREINFLKSENTSLRELIQQMNSDNNKLQMRCTQIELDLSQKERILKAHERSRDADCNEFVKELETQLTESRSKITALKDLLDESTFDYRDLLETNKHIKEENERLLSELATTSNAVEDLKHELHEYQKMLFVKTEEIEELENKLEEMNDNISAEQGKENSRLLELENLLSECENSKLAVIQKLEISEKKIEQLSSCLIEAREELEQCKKELDNLRKTKSGVHIKSEVPDSEDEDETEKLGTGTNDLDSLRRENEILSSRCSEQEEEIKCLQKEIKILTSKIRDFSKDGDNCSIEKDLTNKNLDLMNDIDRYKKSMADLEKLLEEEKDNCEKYKSINELVINDLRQKLEAAECQANVMKKIKEETEKEASRIPELEDKIKQLEKEVNDKKNEIEVFEDKKRELFGQTEMEIGKLTEENHQLKKERISMLNKMEALERDGKAEVSRLKELLKAAEEEIFKLNMETENKPPLSPVKNVDSGVSKLESPHAISNVTRVESIGRLSVKERDLTPERLSKEIEKLSIFYSETKKSTRKVVDSLEQSIHPSLIKSRGKNKMRVKKGTKKEGSSEKKEENCEVEEDKKEGSNKKDKKCRRKLYVENDFDDLCYLDSPFTEPEIPRLRPRRK